MTLRQLCTVDAFDTRTAPTSDDNVAAHVHYIDAQRVSVWHPKGANHVNAVLTRRRLLRRGYIVLSGTGPTHRVLTDY